MGAAVDGVLPLSARRVDGHAGGIDRPFIDLARFSIQGVLAVLL